MQVQSNARNIFTGESKKETAKWLESHTQKNRTEQNLLE